ncbi:hypothetical protein B296_00056464 [Ensete ventricosum]|uniref:Uncharacterized protein n=1 Tax=Ensete ventricosum TaxID=4639 RepID=A0A426XV37_ENSVE|nr:hypothetical protein B296_00056464 [Ensete ventricosum]
MVHQRQHEETIHHRHQETAPGLPGLWKCKVLVDVGGGTDTTNPPNDHLRAPSHHQGQQLRPPKGHLRGTMVRIRCNKI